MKKFIPMLLMVFLLSSSTVVAGDTIEQGWQEDTENLWKTGSGAHDGASSAISATMIGWGVGLALGIAILTAVLHQSKDDSGTSHCHNR